MLPNASLQRICVEVPSNVTAGTVLSVAVSDREQPVKIRVPEGCSAGDRLLLSSEDGKTWSLNESNPVARPYSVTQLKLEHDTLKEDVRKIEADLEEAKAQLQNTAQPWQSDTCNKRVRFEDDLTIIPDLCSSRRRLRRRERNLALKEAGAIACEHELVRLKGLIELRDEELADIKREIQKNLEEAELIRARLDVDQSCQTEPSSRQVPILTTDSLIESMKETRASPKLDSLLQSEKETREGLSAYPPSPPLDTLTQSIKARWAEHGAQQVFPNPGPGLDACRLDARSATPKKRLKWQSPQESFTPPAPPQSRSFSVGANVRRQAPNSVQALPWGASTLRNIPLLVANAKH